MTSRLLRIIFAEMYYSFHATSSSFVRPDILTLVNRLQERYCQDKGFEDHRIYGVTVNWIYWGRDGSMLHKYSSSECMTAAAWASSN